MTKKRNPSTSQVITKHDRVLLQFTIARIITFYDSMLLHFTTGIANATSVITIHNRYYNSRRYYISRQHPRGLFEDCARKFHQEENRSKLSKC